MCSYFTVQHSVLRFSMGKCDVLFLFHSGVRRHMGDTLPPRETERVREHDMLLSRPEGS